MFRTQHRTRTIRVTATGGVALLLGLVGGCQGVSQSEYDLAVQENTQLRDRIGALQDSLQRAETDKQVLQARRTDIENELARLRGEIVDARSQANRRDPDGFEQRGDDRVATVAGDLLFESGKATIRREGRQELDRIAGVIQQRFPRQMIRVEGHTDTDPIRKSGWKTNERLSAERALVVEEYLVSKGINASQIYSAAMGPARPKSDKTQSRRVEIVILPDALAGG